MSSGISEVRLADRDLCFIDVETTGLKFAFHEVIEFGAVRVSPDAAIVRGELSFRIHPKHPDRFSEQAKIVNGYSKAAWNDTAKDGTDAWREFAVFAEGCVPVCHNPSFDRVFVALSAREYGIEELGLDYHWVGTESIAWPLVHRGFLLSLSLKSLCGFFDVPPEPEPHRAIEGARACLSVYRSLRNASKLA